MEINVAQSIKDLRAKAHLTQAEIAKAIGCSQANVSYLENTTAPRARPSYQVISALKALREKHAAALAS